MNSRPRLLILSFSPIIGDARVLKQVRHFTAEYDVTTCGHGDAPDGVHTHLEVPSGLPIWRYDRASVIARRYSHAYWNNPAILAAQALLAGHEFDVVLANDIDAVGLAQSLNPRFGVHADLHEYAPRVKEEMLRWRLFVAPFMRWMVRTFVTRADSVTTVGGGLAREYERRFGVHAGVVTNAAPYVDLPVGPTRTPVRLVHSGACLRSRNILALIDAVDQSEGAATLDLFLTPNEPQYLAEVKRRAADVAGVIVHDPVPYDRLVETLNAYDVGVHLLPPVNFNNEWALPNKLFDYVQARLGVIVGPSAEMAAYVKEYGLGLVTEDFTADALARTLATVTPDAVDRFKAAADAAAVPMSAEAQTLIWDEAIRRLVSS